MDGRWKVKDGDDLESPVGRRTFQRQKNVGNNKSFNFVIMKTKLDYGKYYHIFNRGNNYEDIFLGSEDCLHFLDRLDVYIGSIADIFAWALLRNHFHLLLRVKEENEIGYFNSKDATSENPYVKWRTHFPEVIDDRFAKKPRPSEQFQHFFNAYSRWFNKRHGRSGSLFQKNYERKEVTHERYFTNLVVYIHTNPIRHGFADHILDYPWTSYLIIKTEKPTNLKRKQVINYFDSIDNFDYLHDKPDEENDEIIKGLIIE